MEIDKLPYGTKQFTGFYMMRKLALNWLKEFFMNLKGFNITIFVFVKY